MSALVELYFSNLTTEKLDLFPCDKDGDLVVILPKNMEYRYKKEDLIKESGYFREFATNDKTKEAIIMLINRKFDVQVFNSVMKCFYGYRYLITKDADIYSAYQIVHFLQMDLFKRIIERSMKENFQAYDFLVVFQLAHQYQLESLL